MKLPSEPVTTNSSDSWNDGDTLLTSCRGARLLIVDDELAHRKVLATMLEQCGVPCKTASSAREALDLLQIAPADAVISDLNMPGISGMELLTQVRLRYPHIVFLMATGMEDVRLGVEAMRQGADDYLVKPLQLDSMMMSLDRAFHKRAIEKELEHYRDHLEVMVCERTVQLQRALGRVEESYADTLDALGAAIDLRDGQTAGHSRRVALYSMQMLSRMKGTPEQLRTLVMGAWLHDIGKLAIPDSILLKPASLTEAERRIMQRHVQIGYDLVSRIPFLMDAAEIILTHHERWDGSGYPRGLKGADIPLSGRIFAVADTLDAMTSDRPYRHALPLQTAREEIMRMAGTQFDPHIVRIIMRDSDETLEAIRDQSSTVQISAVLAGFCLESPFISPERQTPGAK
jgi:response regulator RpfG family c-di-GMP phosphodiesterase